MRDSRALKRARASALGCRHCKRRKTKGFATFSDRRYLAGQLDSFDISPARKHCGNLPVPHELSLYFSLFLRRGLAVARLNKHRTIDVIVIIVAMGMQAPFVMLSTVFDACILTCVYSHTHVRSIRSCARQFFCVSLKIPSLESFSFFLSFSFAKFIGFIKCEI